MTWREFSSDEPRVTGEEAEAWKRGVVCQATPETELRKLEGPLTSSQLSLLYPVTLYSLPGPPILTPVGHPLRAFLMI